MSQLPTPTSQIVPLPDYHRGYIDGILDSKNLLEAIANKPVPKEVDTDPRPVSMKDAFAVFKSQFAAIASAFEAKAKEAQRIATNAMLSGGQGGRA